MSTISQVSEAMQTVLTTAAQDADAKLHYTKRPDRAKFSASTLVQTLVFGFLAHPDASLEQLSQTAATVGVDATPQAIDQRFTFATAALLQEVLKRSVQLLIRGDTAAVPLLNRFESVVVQDSTTIRLPDALSDHWAGCGGSTAHNTSAALKCGVQLDLLSGALPALDLADGRTSDHRLPLQTAPLPPRTLRLADLGFLDLDVLADHAAAGAFFLSKLEARMLVSDAEQCDCPLLAFVQQLGDLAQWDGWVRVGKGGRLPARLLVQRVPQEVADKRRRKLYKDARDKGKMPSKAALCLVNWTILMTNVAEEMLTLSEALVVAKVRWQIELLFKLWKSKGLVDEWRTEKPERILCEVYAKLLAMVIQHWIVALSCWAYADRSLVKASGVIRDHVPALAAARTRQDLLTQALETICRILKRTARMTTRHKRPNTYQLLLALTTQEKQA